MIIDKSLEFSSAQAVTATANATNSIDLQTVRDIGHGEELSVVAQCVADMTDAASDSTVTVTLVTSDAANLGSPTTLATVGVFAAGSKAGTKVQYKLPVGLAYKQYIGVAYTVANGDLTTGKFTSFLTPFDPPVKKTYASGFNVA